MSNEVMKNLILLAGIKISTGAIETHLYKILSNAVELRLLILDFLDKLLINVCTLIYNQEKVHMFQLIWNHAETGRDQNVH
ncbi:hypothetical protein BpHYR1_007472 [Brachionus plicatilis]|uniref:Uncharacterized protein n=1 Tax=Brachionus plicatilis TaxID=10195 RepID=A0A3M7Q5Q7_BRAPC|nr:hypothetical protein BpHYR1_007472 [Brachionus plicatilis]